MAAPVHKYVAASKAEQLLDLDAKWNTRIE